MKLKIRFFAWKNLCNFDNHFFNVTQFLIFLILSIFQFLSDFFFLICPICKYFLLFLVQISIFQYLWTIMIKMTKRSFSIMHNWTRIIGSSISVRIHFCIFLKILFVAWLDIFPNDLKILITIISIMLMIKAQSMHNFMRNAAYANLNNMAARVRRHSSHKSLTFSRKGQIQVVFVHFASSFEAWRECTLLWAHAFVSANCFEHMLFERTLFERTLLEL